MLTPFLGIADFVQGALSTAQPPRVRRDRLWIKPGLDSVIDDPRVWADEGVDLVRQDLADRSNFLGEEVIIDDQEGCHGIHGFLPSFENQSQEVLTAGGPFIGAGEGGEITVATLGRSITAGGDTGVVVRSLTLRL